MKEEDWTDIKNLASQVKEITKTNMNVNKSVNLEGNRFNHSMKRQILDDVVSQRNEGILPKEDSKESFQIIVDYNYGLVK